MDNRHKIKIAGILNLTPDSFYEESRVMGHDHILEATARLCSEGADMIDIGACSTRPGGVQATSEQEMKRLETGMPAVLEACPALPLSIDTFRPEIASTCVDRWGVDIINDISGGSEEMFNTVAATGAGYILTFNREVYGDILPAMLEFFETKLEQLFRAGAGKVILDPGFGFAKTLEQNYRILANLDCLKQFKLPVMAALSRKSMAYRLLDITPAQALEATVVLDTVALMKGAEWLRVHDVKEAVQTVRLIEELNINKN
ncbi:MAG: dihydropteroate synthase [Bacteroidaceae bacterium]|nr:dihydropteroate synthase [Bacteroidaceae bacterium]